MLLNSIKSSFNSFPLRDKFYILKLNVNSNIYIFQCFRSTLAYACINTGADQSKSHMTSELHRNATQKSQMRLLFI